jgi:hypothetical protein
MKNYLLGTGYFDGGTPGLNWFAKLWLDNTILYADPLPQRIVVLSVGDSHPPYPREAAEGLVKIDTLDFEGNLGHVHQLLGRAAPPKKNAYCGAIGAFMTLSLIAYSAELDFVYKEQDCLAFGPWLNRLYHCAEGGSMAFGRGQELGSAQSLFLVRHWFIPAFVRFLLEAGSERELANLPEFKFNRLIAEMPDQVKWLDFGYDRDRPFNHRDTVWYAQKLTPEELRLLARERLVDVSGMPTGTPVFTNLTTSAPPNSVVASRR